MYRVTPPTFRVDISREIDLVEEIARLYGYGRVPVTMPAATGMPQGKQPKQVLEEGLRALLAGCGFSEVVTYSFVPSAFPAVLGLKDEDEATRLVRLRNPLTEEQAVMRTTMIYNLLDTMAKNNRAGLYDLKIFEIGRVYFAAGEGELPVERNRVAGLISGLRYGESWHAAGLAVDFYDLKGVIENVASGLKLADLRFTADAPWPFLHPGRSGRIHTDRNPVGFLGEVHPRVLEAMDLRHRAVVFELDLDHILRSQKEAGLSFREVSKFPSSSRDVAFVVARETDAQRLLDAAFGQDEELLEKVSIFDVYVGKNIPEGAKSLGLRFAYRSGDRTLTDEDVNKAHSRIVNAVIEETQAKIRE
jgi:phenylalanyl-tRNA synthetase beta chain